MKKYLISGILLLILCSICLLFVGELPWNFVWSSAKERLMGTSTQWNPLLDERLPRLIVIICTGASLAVAGAIMQSLFHNPLASPSILGISAGGSLLVVLVFIFNWQMTHPYAITLAAILGCFLTLCLVYTISSFNDDEQLTNLILIGIAVASIFLSIREVFLFSLRENWQLIQMITEWENGSTVDRGWQHVHMQLPLTIVGLIGSLIYRKEMNLLSLGEQEALNLGVDVKQVRWRLFLCVALLTGGALAAVGIIAFFGLVLPHIVRTIQGPDHRTLIPLCIIFGAMALVSLDLFLRLFGIYKISIGNVSSILGGFFFLMLLFQKQKERLSHL